MIVYMVRNKINNMKYVGATIATLFKRKYNHYYTAEHNKTTCRFHKALLEYDKEDFEWTVIETVDNLEDSEKLEIYYIGYYDTYNNGYNETLGGKGPSGMKHNNVTKQRISEVRKGKKPSDITKQRMSETHTGMKRSKEHRKNSAKAHSKAVMINGKTFSSLTEAGKFIGVSVPTIWYRINHLTKWLGYQYTNK